MKVIIDPYRGGKDTGENYYNQYEKNILLEISRYMATDFAKKNIDTELVRNTDVSLTDDERNSIINEIKNKNDLIIQNRISDTNEFNIIYPLRSNDILPSLISTSLEANDINVTKYFQRRLPTDTILDYYSVIRNTNPNETIIFEYPYKENYEKTIDIIVDTIAEYLTTGKIYTVAKGDSLYQIAKKYNTTVDELKKLNNLSSNNLTIGMKLKIPVSSSTTNNEETPSSTKTYTYQVKKGDTLYQIAKNNNTTVDAIKKLNNLSSNTLTIGSIIKLPSSNTSSNTSEEDIYIVKSGDTLYQIAKNNNTTVDAIKKLNNLSSNTLTIGQTLLIPLPKEEYIIYTVIKGDSLYQIARKNNTTVDEIKKLNNLTTNTLTIGQELKIPR